MSELKIYRGLDPDTDAPVLVIKDFANNPMVAIYEDRVNSVSRFMVYRDLIELECHPKGDGVWINGDANTIEVLTRELFIATDKYRGPIQHVLLDILGQLPELGRKAKSVEPKCDCGCAIQGHEPACSIWGRPDDVENPFAVLFAGVSAEDLQWFFGNIKTTPNHPEHERLMEIFHALVAQLPKLSGEDEVVHRCPIGDASVVPCCGTLVFELPLDSRMTLDDSLVTCKPLASAEIGDGLVIRMTTQAPFQFSIYTQKGRAIHHNATLVLSEATATWGSIVESLVGTLRYNESTLVPPVPVASPKEPPYRSVVITQQVSDIPELNHQSVPWAYQRTVDSEDGDLSWQMMATSDQWYSWKQICVGATVVFDPSVDEVTE